MTKKSFVVILVLSIVVNEIVLYIDALIRNSVVAGQGGFPLRFTSSSSFGNASTNWTALLFDILFWFLVIWGVWRIIKRSKKNKKR